MLWIPHLRRKKTEWLTVTDLKIHAEGQQRFWKFSDEN